MYQPGAETQSWWVWGVSNMAVRLMETLCIMWALPGRIHFVFLSMPATAFLFPLEMLCPLEVLDSPRRGPKSWVRGVHLSYSPHETSRKGKSSPGSMQCLQPPISRPLARGISLVLLRGLCPWGMGVAGNQDLGESLPESIQGWPGYTQLPSPVCPHLNGQLSAWLCLWSRAWLSYISRHFVLCLWFWRFRLAVH